MMVWAGCRMIKLSLEHGICSDSLFGFFLYSGSICRQSTSAPVTREACRVGKAVMSLIERPGFVESTPDLVPRAYFIYYGFVATWSDPLQVCAANLRKGFEGEQTFVTCPFSFLCCQLMNPPPYFYDSCNVLQWKYCFLQQYASCAMCVTWRRTLTFSSQRDRRSSWSNAQVR